jgi:D-alanyl-D-alanine endopeptidase (penicillin-binding protein 7)
MWWSIIFNLFAIIFAPLNPWPATQDFQGALIALKPGVAPAQVTAASGAVLVANDHYFLFTKRADASQPIASISKLMTALVFLDHNPGWTKVYQVAPADNIAGGHLNLFLGDRVTVKDLFYTALVASDNGATMALVHATGLSQADFVAQMNATAKRLGLLNTHFAEPTGLSDSNISTAREVAIMAQAAFARPEIRQATTLPEYKFTTLDGRANDIVSTDYLLSGATRDSLEVLAGKTGYTDPAGYCFVGLLQDPAGRQFISVVLNSTSKNERFIASEDLVNWVLTSYNWKR